MERAIPIHRTLPSRSPAVQNCSHVGFDCGDIVQTHTGSVGIVVGHLSLTPSVPTVLIGRTDDRFGGFEDAFSYHQSELRKIAHVEARDYPAALRGWMANEMERGR